MVKRLQQVPGFDRVSFSGQAMLVSERTTAQIVDLTYDYRKLKVEIKQLLKHEQAQQIPKLDPFKFS